MPLISMSGRAPTLGVYAVLDDKQFQDRVKFYLNSLKDMEKATDELADKSAKADKKRQKDAEEANTSIAQSLRALRWEMVSLLFFLRMARRAWTTYWTAMADATEEASQRMGIRALARELETDLGAVSAQIRDLSGSTIDIQKSFQIVLQGLLTDQGQFSAEYARLWEAARVAAVTGMEEADAAFEAFLTDLREGTGAATDAISPIYQVGNALREYAAQTGRTVEQLSQVEAAHVTLQQIYRTTNELLGQGAREALDSAGAWNTLQAELKNLKTIVGVLVTEGEGLEQLTKLLQAAQRTVILLAAAFGAAKDQMGQFGDILSKFPGIAGLPAMVTELVSAYRGDPSEEFKERMKKYLDAMGAFRDEWVDKSKIDYDKLRATEEEALDVSPIVDHLMKRERLVEDHLYRMEQIEERYQDRVRDINNRYIKNSNRIRRNAQQEMDRATRNFNRRMEEVERDHYDRMAKAEEQYRLRVEQNRREFRLKEMQSEAMYLYERSQLVAYGDVLAVEDLDARYALEKEARAQNFQEQQRQERENYELQRKWMRDNFQDQLSDLRRAYDEQMEEIYLRERERLDEAQERRKEELADAEAARADQLEAEDRQHRQSLEQWNVYWVKLAERFKLGADDIKTILSQYFGAGGELDSIMKSFQDRWNDYMKTLLQIQNIMGNLIKGATFTMPAPAPSPSDFLPPVMRPYQFGGETVVSRPSNLRVGEGHQPEMVSVRPMSPLPNVSISWAGPSIPVTGTGLEGADTRGIGDAIAQGLLIALQKQLIRAGATYA